MNERNSFNRMPAVASAGQVTAVVELMFEMLHEPLTLGRLVVALGISGRSLRQESRRYDDTTPLTSLRNLRLEAVHRELSRLCTQSRCGSRRSLIHCLCFEAGIDGEDVDLAE